MNLNFQSRAWFEGKEGSTLVLPIKNFNSKRPLDFIENDKKDEEKGKSRSRIK